MTDQPEQDELPDKLKREIGYLVAHGTYLQDEVREKSFLECVRDIETWHQPELRKAQLSTVDRLESSINAATDLKDYRQALNDERKHIERAALTHPNE